METGRRDEPADKAIPTRQMVLNALRVDMADTALSEKNSPDRPRGRTKIYHIRRAGNSSEGDEPDGGKVRRGRQDCPTSRACSQGSGVGSRGRYQQKVM